MRTLFCAAVLLLAANVANAQIAPYVNPLDGKTYSAEWKPAQAGAAKLGPSNGVSLQGIRLLSPQQAFDKNLDPQKLETLIEDTIANVAFVAGTPGKPFALLLETTITPSSPPKFSMASRGSTPDGAMARIYKGLGSLPDIRSKLDTLKYQMELRVGEEEGKGKK